KPEAEIAEDVIPAPPQVGTGANSTAEALADAIINWSSWVTRRIDSVQLLEGSRGRLKHSIDCVPPPDPQLAYEESERVLQNISSVQGQLMVPLAFISKAPMRHLDVTRTDGTPMPLLGSEETSSFIFRTVIFLLTKSGVQESD